MTRQEAAFNLNVVKVIFIILGIILIGIGFYKHIAYENVGNEYRV